MNAATYNPGGSAYAYRISQPAVLMTYFRRFFLPLDLSADTDRKPYASIFDENAVFGFLFILAICAAIFWCRKRRETRPIAFGLYWFIVACIPTSWVALAEVENDHRLFFPFVGLAMSVCWAAALWLYRHPLPRPVVAGVGALLLASAAWGAHERNEVWSTPETLWYDVTQKSPANGRGLMNYGLSQMAAGRYTVALDYFNRALVFNPNYSVLETNLGIVNGALHNDAEAERNFLRAIELEPSDAGAKMYYARWLDTNRRVPEAITNLIAAIAQKPDYLDARHLLMQIYADLGDRDKLRTQATETLAIFPSDAVARDWLAKAATVVATTQASTAGPTAEGYLNQSLVLYQAGKYAESITAAREALKIRPGYAAAWNNITASYNAVYDWDNAIAAGEKAVSLDPANQLARNNLEWAKNHKAMAASVRSK
jgi:tetratricopeptide (TPR) repeat protein